jgi:phosphate butyryltransferase
LIKRFDDIIKAAKQKSPKTIAVAVAQDVEVLNAVNNAKNLGIAEAVLIGDANEIEKAADKSGIDLSKFEMIDIEDKNEACRKAVELVSTGKAHIVMKGLVDTSIILKAVLDENIGLRTGNVLSHVAVFDVAHYDRLFYVTDAAMNIAPNLMQKKQIIENAVVVANALDNDNPKVAVLAAVEKVNPKMQATLDAAELVKMNKEGLLKGCIVGGPFALDNAVSVEAAKHKGIDHPVAGNADILMVPMIEAGNMLYKSMVFFAKAKNAGILVGAKAPVVLTSRADSDEAKLNSIAIGVLMASR